MGMAENHPIDTFIAPPCDGDIGILFQDEHFLLINKPSGLLSVPGKAPHHKDSLQLRVQRVFPTATIVHRLDMATSGILIMAMNKEAHRHISRQFEMRQTLGTDEWIEFSLTTGLPIKTIHKVICEDESTGYGKTN